MTQMLTLVTRLNYNWAYRMEIRQRRLVTILNVLIFVFLVGCNANNDVNAKDKLIIATDGELSMETETFDQLYSSMIEQTGSNYVKSRDAILKSSEFRKEAIQKTQAATTARVDWRSLLTAEILSGWINNQEQFNLCRDYAQGNLPGRRPLPGFTAQHRAKAISALGTSIIPRILEIVWKSKEYNNLDEASALLGAALSLKDQRFVEPLIELIEGDEPKQLQALSIAVLAATKGEREFDFINQHVKQTTGEDPVRLRAIIALGAFENRKSTDTLWRILSNNDLSATEHRSAAQGMRLQPKAFSRETVMQRLEIAWDEGLVLNLISIMGQIGTSEDIPALKLKSHMSEMIGDYVEDAIEDIESR